MISFTNRYVYLSCAWTQKENRCDYSNCIEIKIESFVNTHVRFSCLPWLVENPFG